jgi:dTDP-glucose 4,6-dehydratase
MQMRVEGVAVLVTGAGGFIGSHLVEALVRRGAKVRAFVRYTSSGGIGRLAELPDDVRSEVETVLGDLRDGDAVRRAVSGCDVVLHLGALIAIPYSYVHPLEYVQVNVVGTANLLCACRDLEVSRLVHTSTSEVYGTARYVPIDEDHPLQGQSPYSATKIAADKLVESHVLSFDLPAVTVRPFNTYGPRQSTRAVIPTIITQALAGSGPRLGSLEPTRDFNFVTDTVEGMLAAATAEGCIGQTLNLGTGEEISIGEVATRILGKIDSGLSVAHDAERVRPPSSEVERLCADASRAREVLGWEPQVGLDQGLEQCISYYRDEGEVDPSRYHV